MEIKKGGVVMKRIFCLVLIFALVACAGCSVKKADFFDVFRGTYTAEVEGTLYDVAFSAKIEMGAQGEGGCAPATITFYAPDALSGTVITRAQDGRVTVESGGLLASDMGGVGAALFSLFPIAGEVTHTEVTDEGRTRLLVEGVEIEFLADGTPYSVKAEDVTVTVIKWNALK